MIYCVKSEISMVFNLLHSSMNQELFEKHCSNQISHSKNHGPFVLCKGSHHVLLVPLNEHFLFCITRSVAQSVENSIKIFLHTVRTF